MLEEMQALDARIKDLEKGESPEDSGMDGNVSDNNVSDNHGTDPDNIPF